MDGSVPPCAVSGLRWPVLPWASISPPRSFDREPPLSRWIETNGRAASADNRAVPTDAHSSGRCCRATRARLAAVLLRVVPVSPCHVSLPRDGLGSSADALSPGSGSCGCCHRARELSIATHALKSGGEANASDHRRLEAAVRLYRCVWTMIRSESLSWFTHVCARLPLHNRPGWGSVLPEGACSKRVCPEQKLCC